MVGWQWHQYAIIITLCAKNLLTYLLICTWLLTGNHANTSSLSATDRILFLSLDFQPTGRK